MKAFNKDIVRSIRHSLGRFIAIAAIVALGTGFYAGLRMTAPDMNLAADAYYDENDLMDIRVVSPLGLTDGDLGALRQVQGVQAVMGAYTTDVLASLTDEQYVIRVHSLPAYDDDTKGNEEGNDDSFDPENIEKVESDGSVETNSTYLNRLQLVDGRWPTAPGECVMSYDIVASAAVDLGDKVVIETSANDADTFLDYTEFTVVGRAHSPLYVSTTAMGASTIGSGSVDQFMYVAASDFKDDLPFMEAYITVEGAAELPTDSSAYDERVNQVIEEIKAIAPEREQLRVEELKAEAQKSLDEGWVQYREEEKKAQGELADARAQLDQAKAELDQSRTKLNNAAATLADKEKEIQAGKNEYSQGLSELASRRAEANAQFSAAQTKIDAEATRVSQAVVSLPHLQTSLEQVIAALALPGLPEAQRAQLLTQKAQLEQAIEQINQATAALEEGKAALAAQRTQAEKEFEEAQSKLDQARHTIDDGESQLASGRAQYSQGQSDLQNGQAEYDEGLAKYEMSAAEADQKLADARQELANAQQEIEEISPSDWLVMDRSKNVSIVGFENDAARIDSIASFFPFIFFIVAALVALTTMTRMVEEERGLIGTFKALGYSQARITSKYLIYALLAAGIGSIVGIATLSQILPWVIMGAYSIVYYVPPGSLAIDWPIALMSAALGVGITLAATWFAAAATLRATPASLMRPPAPKNGKRILLEHVGPLWKRLSFSWKVTARNIFRYKKRLVMTLIGIIGCTALLLTGLGLHNAINDIIDIQFGQITHYNIEVTEKPDATEEERAAADAITDDEDLMPQAVRATDSSMIALGGKESEEAQNSSNTEVLTTIISPEDAEGFKELWTFRERTSGKPLELDDDGVLITEKLSNKLGIGVGDSITFAEMDSLGNATTTTYSLSVAGIIENYVYDYAFMSQKVYKDTFGKEPENLSIFAHVADSHEEQLALSEALRATEAVDTVAFNQESIDAYRKMLQSVDLVVVVLVVAAAALAFIVLYNLTNINITERTREIATLKVLGFTRREVNAYIFREIVLLTILGALLGLFLGIFLESFVVVTAEVDQVMFGRIIHAESFVLAFVLTMVFTVVVMIAMRPKLSHINMVESLKSVE